MIETLLVLGAVALLAALGWLVPLLPAEVWVTGGFHLIAVGMALGVPTGLWYHVALHRALRAQGPPPARWWLRPVAQHARLARGQHAAVLPWFYAGGLGFLLTLLGCAGVVLGLVVEASRAGLL